MATFPVVFLNMKESDKKNINKKWSPAYRQGGMTYVELIVALTIFSIMSAVVLSNYQSFQDRINVVNLANDIGLKIVQAQKDASSGTLPLTLPITSVAKNLSTGWKPAYGMLFDSTKNTSFVYFTDLSDSGYCDTSCENPPSQSQSGTDYLDTINITGGKTISGLKIFYQDGTFANPTNFSLVFERSSSGVTMYTYGTTGVGQILSNIDHVSITLSSPSGNTSTIEVYSSGRIQID